MNRDAHGGAASGDRVLGGGAVGVNVERSRRTGEMENPSFVFVHISERV